MRWSTMAAPPTLEQIAASKPRATAGRARVDERQLEEVGSRLREVGEACTSGHPGPGAPCSPSAARRRRRDRPSRPGSAYYRWNSLRSPYNARHGLMRGSRRREARYAVTGTCVDALKAGDQHTARGGNHPACTADLRSRVPRPDRARGSGSARGDPLRADRDLRSSDAAQPEFPPQTNLTAPTSEPDRGGRARVAEVTELLGPNGSLRYRRRRDRQDAAGP